MKSVNAMIVDDELLARKRLRSMLEDRHDVHVVAECNNGNEAAVTINRLGPDVVFLDIQMPEQDGFEVVQAIAPEQLPMIVFVTAFGQHAVRAFEVNALDYLLKPFDADRLARTIGRVRRQMSLNQSEKVDFNQRVISVIDELRSKTFVDRLALKLGGRLHFVAVADIAWMEAAGNYIRVYVNNQQFLLRETMKKLEQRLNPEQFVRIHRSTMVNLSFVQALEPTFHGDFRVLLVDGTSLPLSRKYRAALRSRFEVEN